MFSPNAHASGDYQLVWAPSGDRLVPWVPAVLVSQQNSSSFVVRYSPAHFKTNDLFQVAEIQFVSDGLHDQKFYRKFDVDIDSGANDKTFAEYDVETTESLIAQYRDLVITFFADQADQLLEFKNNEDSSAKDFLSLLINRQDDKDDEEDDSHDDFALQNEEDEVVIPGNDEDDEDDDLISDDGDSNENEGSIDREQVTEDAEVRTKKDNVAKRDSSSSSSLSQTETLTSSASSDDDADKPTQQMRNEEVDDDDDDDFDNIDDVPPCLPLAAHAQSSSASPKSICSLFTPFSLYPKEMTTPLVNAFKISLRNRHQYNLVDMIRGSEIIIGSKSDTHCKNNHNSKNVASQSGNSSSFFVGISFVNSDEKEKNVVDAAQRPTKRCDNHEFVLVASYHESRARYGSFSELNHRPSFFGTSRYLSDKHLRFIQSLVKNASLTSIDCGKKLLEFANSQNNKHNNDNNNGSEICDFYETDSAADWNELLPWQLLYSVDGFRKDDDDDDVDADFLLSSSSDEADDDKTTHNHDDDDEDDLSLLEDFVVDDDDDEDANEQEDIMFWTRQQELRQQSSSTNNSASRANNQNNIMNRAVSTSSSIPSTINPRNHHHHLHHHYSNSRFSGQNISTRTSISTTNNANVGADFLSLRRNNNINNNNLPGDAGAQKLTMLRQLREFKRIRRLEKKRNKVRMLNSTMMNKNHQRLYGNTEGPYQVRENQKEIHSLLVHPAPLNREWLSFPVKKYPNATRESLVECLECRMDVFDPNSKEGCGGLGLGLDIAKSFPGIFAKVDAEKIQSETLKMSSANRMTTLVPTKKHNIKDVLSGVENQQKQSNGRGKNGRFNNNKAENSDENVPFTTLMNANDMHNNNISREQQQKNKFTAIVNDMIKLPDKADQLIKAELTENILPQQQLLVARDEANRFRWGRESHTAHLLRIFALHQAMIDYNKNKNAESAKESDELLDTQKVNNNNHNNNNHTPIVFSPTKLKIYDRSLDLVSMFENRKHKDWTPSIAVSFSILRTFFVPQQNQVVDEGNEKNANNNNNKDTTNEENPPASKLLVKHSATNIDKHYAFDQTTKKWISTSPEAKEMEIEMKKKFDFIISLMNERRKLMRIGNPKSENILISNKLPLTTTATTTTTTTTKPSQSKQKQKITEVNEMDSDAVPVFMVPQAVSSNNNTKSSIANNSNNSKTAPQLASSATTKRQLTPKKHLLPAAQKEHGDSKGNNSNTHNNSHADVPPPPPPPLFAQSISVAVCPIQQHVEAKDIERDFFDTKRKKFSSGKDFISSLDVESLVAFLKAKNIPPPLVLLIAGENYTGDIFVMDDFVQDAVDDDAMKKYGINKLHVKSFCRIRDEILL